MDFEVFERLIDDARQRQPIWFELETDQPPNASQIQHAQQQLNCLLPDDYLRFISRHGGGFFALGTVYSLDPASSLNLVLLNQQYAALRGQHVLFSDNGCGDLYGFAIRDGRCLPRVSIYRHDDERWSSFAPGDFLQFLLAHCVNYQERT